jgi:predicted nucleic acid-binding protein
MAIILDADVVIRATGKHRVARQRYLNAILESLPIIPYTEQTAYEHARIRAELEVSGKMIGFYDLIVAQRLWSEGTSTSHTGVHLGYN